MDRVFSLITEKDMNLPLYVSGVGYEEYQDHVTRNGGLHECHLAFCENGTGKYLIDNNEFIIDKGKAFFFYHDVPHEYYPISEPWSIRWIIFLGFGVDALLDAVGIGTYKVFKYNSLEEIMLCYNKLYKILKEKKSDSILEASGIFYSFLSNINSIIEPEATENKTHIIKKINIVTEEIQNNLQQDLSLEELATLAGISPSYLCRIFKKTYGMTPFSYILRCRINVAKELLINYPDKSIKNIALESGFNNSSYFGSVFKDHEGCSPNQFRKQYLT